jgi:polyribonucleotide nucleotidyltransferase
VIERDRATARKHFSTRTRDTHHEGEARPDRPGDRRGRQNNQRHQRSFRSDDITIEDDGSIFITGKNGSAQMAKAMIEALVKEYKAGEVYDGEVTRMMDFGAFVRIGPGKDAEGLVHVSEVAPFRIDKIAARCR